MTLRVLRETWVTTAHTWSFSRAVPRASLWPEALWTGEGKAEWGDNSHIPSWPKTTVREVDPARDQPLTQFFWPPGYSDIATDKHSLNTGIQFSRWRIPSPFHNSSGKLYDFTHLVWWNWKQVCCMRCEIYRTIYFTIQKTYPYRWDNQLNIEAAIPTLSLSSFNTR